MGYNDNIKILDTIFDNYNEDSFFIEIPAKDLSAGSPWHYPFLLTEHKGFVYPILKGADRSKLKYEYFYIHQSKKSGKYYLNVSLSDKINTNFRCKEVKTEEEAASLIERLKNKVENLNKEREKGVLPLNDFIKNNIYKIDNSQKLALFLSKIMKVIFSDNHFVTAKQLKYFSTPNVLKRYKTFHIKKKTGGLREINAPTHFLNNLLYILNIVFKAIYTPHRAVSGFTEGKSIADNALQHIGQHYVFNIDLNNFFTSIPQKRLWGRLQVYPFNFKREVANIIAGLCCCKNSETGENVLPQGAPTSPLLTNAICDKLDKELYRLSTKYGLHYSRYADDITFSSMHNVYQDDSEFRKELTNIIEGQNFCINDKKTRLLRSGQRQEVTGLTVNSKVNVTRKYIRNLRCLLHIWEKQGYEVAYRYFYEFYKKEKGYIKKGEPIMENVIGGKLNYLRMIKGAGNECYKKLLQRFEKLQQIIYVDEDTDQGRKYIFVQSYQITEFENLFDTKITLQVSPKKNLIGRCTLFGIDKSLPITHLTQEVLCPNLKKLHIGELVEAEMLDDCYITLCRQKGKNFWLISREELQRSRCLSINEIIIDTDNFFRLWENEGFIVVAKLFQLVLNKYGQFEPFNVVDFINDVSIRNETSGRKKLGKKRKLYIENQLQKDFFKIISQQEIQEFVYFITHYKHFTYKQKMNVDRLLSRDLAKKYINKSEKVIDADTHRCGVPCEYI